MLRGDVLGPKTAKIRRREGPEAQKGRKKVFFEIPIFEEISACQQNAKNAEQNQKDGSVEIS